MFKRIQKILSALLVFVMVMSFCSPIMNVFAAEDDLTEVKQWNLVIGDEIAANFYVSVSDHVSSEAIMNVTDGYGTTSYNLSGTQKDENGNYIFTARMAAAQMGDTITLQLQDGATTGAIHTYKAVDYARVILKGNYSDNTKAMVKAMLNYGAAAQTYFGYNTENLVNVGYESTETVEIPAVEADKIVTGNVSGISFYGASLVFESKVAVRFYFNVTGNIEDYTFSTGTPVAKNGMYYVEVAGINPQQYADTIALTVNDTMTVYYSPLQYISRMYTKTENADMKALLGAMYAYYLAAGAYEAGSDMLEENAENDWTNLVVDGGMSNAASYGLTGDKTAPGSSQSLKITTNTGDVGNVHLNTDRLSQLPDFTGGMVTGWFYFGDQRPMAFLRGIDSNWNKGITGIFTFEDMGSGWYYGYVAASDLGFEVDKANTNPAEIIRLAVEIPGGYTAYVDNLKWEAISVTEETEKSNDLLAVSSVVAEYSNITAENSTDKVAGIHSLYSKKFTAKAGVSEKKSIRYELPQSYDLTQQALSMDVHRYGVESLVAMQLSLQDSNGATIVDVLVDNIYWLDWNHLEIDIHKYLDDGKSLSDVKYLTFTFNFDADTTVDREIYIDNVAIAPYETVESTLNGASALYIGDSISISKPFKGWAGLLEERYGVDRTNVSVGGTTFSTIGYQIKEQLKNVPEGAEFDYIILDGGCNDMYLGASSFGTVSDLPVTAATSSFDDSTAIGGFEQLLSMLKRRFPTAKIGYIITYQRSDKWLNEFIPLAKDVCEKWGVSCLSLPETEPFIQLFNSNFGAHTTDTVHSNVAGYELIMEYLPQWMESIPEPEIIEGFEPDVGKEVFDGGTFAAGENTTFALDNRNSVSKLSFDYKIDSGETFSIALLADWSNYFGYFKFGANGASVNYPGITNEKLNNGYIRVFVDIPTVTNVAGTPSDVVTILFVRGDSTTANGAITNICINSAVDGEPRGESIIAGEHKNITLNNKDALSKVSFEYKITEGEKFNVALLTDWSNYFGYFAFDANGNVDAYDGVTLEALEDGYTRVTFDIAALTKYSGEPNNVIDIVYIRGDWSDASGYIDNVQIKTAAQPEVPSVDLSDATTTLYVEQGEEFVILNLSDLQLHDGQDPQYTYDIISQLVEKTDPDLITVLGDTAQDDPNYSATTNFANLVKYIDSFDIPWAPIFGNHDHDTYSPGYDSPKGVSDEWIMEQFANAENCIFMEGPADVNGCGNYIVHIKEQGTDKLVRALYFFDSLLVGVDETHVQFYRDAVSYTTSLNNGETLESIVFLHIPLPEYATVYSQQLEVDFTDTVGTVGRPATELTGTTEFFAAIQELGSTQNVIAGHDHENAYYMTYEGVKLIYNMKSSDGDNHYNVAGTGGGVFTIGKTTDFRFEYASVEQEMKEATAFCMPMLADWQNSGKSFSFTFSATDTVTTGNTFSFVLCGSNPRRTSVELKDRHGNWNRLTNTVTIDITKLTASLGTIVDNGDGTYTYSVDLADLPLNNAASETAYGDETLKLVYFNAVNHSVKIGDLCITGDTTPHGYAIVAGENGQIDFAEENYDFASFEYALTSDGEMAFGFLKSDWSKFYGLFKVNANGTAQDYEGITTEKLSDGKIRVTLDLSKVQITNNAGNRDNVPETIGILFIRGDWTTASGMIYNLRFWYGEAGGEVDENYTEIVVPGGSFAANEDFTVNFESGAYDAVTFDYQITNGGEMQICLLSSDWSKYYGYFKFNADGATMDYAGISTEKLTNGYVRVTMMLAELGITNWQDNRDQAPETISILYIRGDISGAAGTIDNIRCITGEISEEPSDPVYRGQEIVVGQDLSVMAEQAANYSQVVLDMIVPAEGGENEIGIALLDANWNYYGYFYLEKTGLEIPYAGVSAEKLPDGYWRITINVDEIDGSRTHGDVGDIERVYINNHTTGGYIDNVQFVQAAPEPDEPEVTYDIATNLVIDVEDGTYDYVTFDYKVTNDGVLYIAALSSDWSKYYGYYEFDVDGKVWEDQGVYCEKLDDGFFRVTLKIAELNRTNNVANLNNKPDHIGLLYVGSSNTATGIIRNVKYGVEASTEPETPEVPDAVNVSYNFSGNEASRAGYAEGTVTVSGNLVSGRVYHFCWANSEGKLDMYRPLGSVTVSAGQSSISLSIGENVAIPAGADRIAVYQNNGVEWAGFAMLDNKANAGQLKVKYAVVSDVHTNYNQGEKYWLNALKQFQAEGVEYIIVSGDIGESNADYAKYISAVESSGFSGVIMACIGNHDQTATGSVNFKNYAIYDGNSKTWVAIDDAPAYFANQYAGDLDISVSIDGNGKAYYFATIGDNAFMFMDQELGPDGGTTTQDNFSQQQLNFVENNLYAYSATHTLHIVEHAPIEQLKVGDKFIPGYGGCIQLSVTYPNNQRFLNLLMEYTEAIWLSGHTHVQYDAGIMYVDKYYDASGNLTDTPIAHSVHIPSLAQPRWYEESGMIMKNDYTAASQGYVCYQYENDVVYEARVFKNYTPDSVNYDESLFINEVESINSLMIPLEKVSHDAPEVIEDLAVAENGYVRQGNVSYEDTADGLKITFEAANNRFEIRTGNQTKGFYNDYYVQFKIKSDLTAISLGGCNYNAGRRTEVIVDLTASGTNYTVTDLGDGWKFVQIPFTALGYEEYLPEFAIRFYNTNAAGTFYLKELFISPFDYSHMRGDTFIGGANKTVNTPVPASDVLHFEYRIIDGSQMYVALLHDWSNYFGYYYFDANGEKQDYAGITTEILADGYVRVTCDVNLLDSIHGTPSAISMIYISKNNGDASGYIDNVCFDFGDSDEEEEDTAVDYAVAINGVKRQGSPTWEDTADGLKVTFAAASDRFEIKTGDQTGAANGTLQFKIKTDLTSITLGGCNYSGLRKTTVTVNLTASGDGFTVTDLGDGWVLVEVPMSVIGVADYLAEFAIRFYNTNAAGTFILKDMNFAA